MRKWSSNKPEVLENLDGNQNDSVGYYKASDDKRKTLGVMWQSSKDVFENVIHAPVTTRGVTKRQILSIIAKLFDPLGLLGPVIIRAKLMLQKLW